MSSIGVPGLILIILVALILFGPSKLPELGRALGRTLREFKQGARDIMEDDGAKPNAQPQAVHPPGGAPDGGSRQAGGRDERLPD